ncbi:hypothetical protein [Sphingobacterium sp. 1.A.4]|uniref:hypothetical protein n=1 Tax=Sphingobacterium sp. 1.A.4 TaxID=2044603 RepID=UPI000C0C0A4E|nr:hypothetical protein [Sphingobacterium sp. 1.A.4]
MKKRRYRSIKMRNFNKEVFDHINKDYIDWEKKRRSLYTTGMAIVFVSAILFIGFIVHLLNK